VLNPTEKVNRQESPDQMPIRQPKTTSLHVHAINYAEKSMTIKKRKKQENLGNETLEEKRKWTYLP